MIYYNTISVVLIGSERSYTVPSVRTFLSDRYLDPRRQVNRQNWIDIFQVISSSFRNKLANSRLQFLTAYIIAYVSGSYLSGFIRFYPVLSGLFCPIGDRIQSDSDSIHYTTDILRLSALGCAYPCLTALVCPDFSARLAIELNPIPTEYIIP